VSDSLGIPLIPYQVLRGTFATLMQKCGTIKDVQAMLRHTSPNLTLGTYMKALPESVNEAVKNLEQAA
jgi:integrase